MEDNGTGVFGLVNPVAYPHNLLMVGDLSLNIGTGILFGADLLEHTDDRFVSAAVETAAQCSDGR